LKVTTTQYHNITTLHSCPTYSPGELNVLDHDGDTFCMNGTQISGEKKQKEEKDSEDREDGEDDTNTLQKKDKKKKKHNNNSRVFKQLHQVSF
jgi:hypothetical protein